MTYRITDQVVGSQPIAETSATQKHPIGTIVRAVDETYGEGEFIYLKGVASTIVGSVVSYTDGDTTVGQTALATTAVADSEPLAVAMSANVAANWGWYQISGVAAMGKANTLSLAPEANIAAASGLVIDAATTNRINGAAVSITASAKSDVITVPVLINRPHGPGVA